MNLEILTNKKNLFVIISMVGMFSFFLPWQLDLGLEKYSHFRWETGFHSAGPFAFSSFGIILLTCLMGEIGKGSDKMKMIVILIAGFSALFFTLINVSLHFDILGVGSWISLICSIGIIIAVLKTNDNKVSIDNFKNTQNSTISVSSKIDELEKLIIMRRNGDITQQEYDELKRNL
ncbi:MAG: SHOCT domain-containing protein [Ignavibacteria bacterium]|nr:SHOCT domain-containing protein [Ignavibacteria bacterium]